MDASELLPGDFVQARMEGATPDGEPEQWLVTEFAVTAVTGTVVAGSVLYPDGLDETAGWTFELITRTIALPDTLCEISAVLTDGHAHTLMGRGDVWSDVNAGTRVPVDQIQSYTAL